MGDGERCLRLGLKAKGALLSSLSWPWLAVVGLSSMLEGYKGHSDD